MERNFPGIPIFRNFRPTSRGTPKFRKITVPFAPQPGISGIFGRMESAHCLPIDFILFLAKSDFIPSATPLLPKLNSPLAPAASPLTISSSKPAPPFLFEIKNGT